LWAGVVSVEKGDAREKDTSSAVIVKMVPAEVIEGTRYAVVDSGPVIKVPG
jgi:hypothetical protein